MTGRHRHDRSYGHSKLMPKDSFYIARSYQILILDVGDITLMCLFTLFYASILNNSWRSRYHRIFSPTHSVHHPGLEVVWPILGALLCAPHAHPCSAPRGSLPSELRMYLYTRAVDPQRVAVMCCSATATTTTGVPRPSLSEKAITVSKKHCFNFRALNFNC